MSSETWQTAPLGRLLRRNEQTISIDPTGEYREVTVRLWGKGVILRGIVPGSSIAADRRVQVSANQFIISKIDARNGAMGLVPPELHGAVVSSDFPTFEADKSLLLPEYLGWLSQTKPFVAECRRASEGTTNRVRLKEERFKAIEIRLPPIDEQIRVVQRIEFFSNRLRQASELRQKVDADITALTSSLHFSLAHGRRVPMSSLVELSEDRVPINPSAYYPQVGIRGFGGGLFAKPPLLGADTTYRHFNRLSANMLVLSQVKGWEGAIAVCPQELTGFYASPEYRTFRCLESCCDPKYLDIAVRSPWFRVFLQEATHGQGARRERTRPEQFLELMLPMPDIEHQRRGVRILSMIKSIDPIKYQTSMVQSAILPSLLDHAFHGEL